MTSDEQALMSAIIADPADDTPRLQLADWLEEQGDADRAEFIRVQCELATKIPCTGSANRNIARNCSDPECHACALCRREWELWDSDKIHCHLSVGNVPLGLSLNAIPPEDCIPPMLGIVRRGLVAEVHTTLQAWMGGKCEQCEFVEASGYAQTDFYSHRPGGVCKLCNGSGTIPGHGPAIVAAHPVERVVFSDAVIHASGGNATYYVGGLGSFPQQYWSQLEDLPSRQAARDAMGRVAIAWAKQQNLPPKRRNNPHPMAPFKHPYLKD